MFEAHETQPRPLNIPGFGWEVLQIATSSGQCAGDTFGGDNVKAIRRVG